MLGKLMKHGFRSFTRALLPLQIGVVGAGVLAAILTRLSTTMANAAHVADGSPASRWLMVFSVLFFIVVGVLLLAVTASAFVSLVLICTRVQKSFFGDEGYLTFSLPTTTEKLLVSKIVTGTAWMLISGAAIVLSIFLFALFGTAEGTLVNASVWQSAGGFFRGLGDLFGGIFSSELPGMWFFSILAVLDGIVYLLLQVILLYFAVIAGGMAAKRHKVLASIGVYLAAHFVLGMVLTIGGVISVTMMALMTPVGAAWLVLIGVLVVLCALAAALFFWSRHLIKNRLNLQ